MSPQDLPGTRLQSRQRAPLRKPMPLAEHAHTDLGVAPGMPREKVLRPDYSFSNLISRIAWLQNFQVSPSLRNATIMSISLFRNSGSPTTVVR